MGCCGPGSGCIQHLYILAFMRFYQLRPVLVKIAEIFNCQGCAKGLLNLMVARAEVLRISPHPPPPPHSRKICSWDSFCALEWLTDTRSGCGMSVWCIDVLRAATEPGSGVRVGACGASAEPRGLQSRQVVLWPRWWPTDLHRHSGSAAEPEPAGHACPYRDS